MNDAGRPLDHAQVVAETRAWVTRAVIGLGLCPFARGPEARGQVRYVVSDADAADALLEAFAAELDLLASVDATVVETTLLIHPCVLADFLDYNDFVGVADATIADRGLEGFAQLATFHPQYRFADTDVDDLGNATNRSPYPMLQLLREASVDRAVLAFPDAADIYLANIATMKRLGSDGWAALQAACRADADLPVTASGRCAAKGGEGRR